MSTTLAVITNELWLLVCKALAGDLGLIPLLFFNVFGKKTNKTGKHIPNPN